MKSLTTIDAKRAWNYADLNEILRIEKQPEKIALFTMTRIAPGDGQITVDWVRSPASGADEAGMQHDRSYWIVCRPRDAAAADDSNGRTEAARAEWKQKLTHSRSGSVVFSGLDNGVDYEISIRAVEQGNPQEKLVSVKRLARPGIVPGTVVNYIHPEDDAYGFSGRSPASPSIIRLPSGKLLASHDVYWGKCGQNLSMIFSSEDEGRSWEFVTYLYPCFWGKLFLVNDALYMLGTSTEYGALLIGRSDDEGKTWSAPVVLIEGGSREEGGPHKAPVPVVVYRDRIWTAIEHGSWQLGGHDTGVISAPVNADLLDASNWTVTPFLKYDANWPGTVQGVKSPSLLEGNVVVTPEGKLVNLLRYHTFECEPDYGRAIYLHIDDEHPEAPLTFGKVIDFHGNMSKFTILYDEKSQMYWSLVNRVTLPNVRQRNILTLVCSRDLEHWQIVRDVLDYQHNGWPEDDKQVGFQYVDWIFDGDDMLFLSRTALNGAHNYHNANYITFHRIENFRASGGE